MNYVLLMEQEPDFADFVHDVVLGLVLADSNTMAVLYNFYLAHLDVEQTLQLLKLTKQNNENWDTSLPN